MKPNNEAVEAGAKALDDHAWLTVPGEGSVCDCGNALAPGVEYAGDAYRSHIAETILTAALPLLHPTIPNTVEALEATHPDTVLMAWDVADPALSYVVMRTASNDYQWAEVGARRPGITEWTVLWPIGGAA